MSTNGDRWLSDQEREWRRRRFEQIRLAHNQDLERQAFLTSVYSHRAEREPEAVALLDNLASDGNLEAFKDEMSAWSRRQGYDSFRGFGQMFVNQIVNAADGDPEVARLIADALRVPADEADAQRKLKAFVGYVERVKKGAHPAPRRVPYVCTLFWSMQDHSSWPCMWPSAQTMLTKLGWLEDLPDIAEHYLEFRRIVLDLGVGPVEVEAVLSWFEDHPFVGLDVTLVERCRAVREVNGRKVDDEYASEQDEAIAAASARAMVGEARLLGDALAVHVSGAIGRSVSVRIPGPFWRKGQYRGDVWTRWAAGEGSPPAGIVVWVTADGTFIGLHPGWLRDGWYDQARDLVGPLVPAGLAFHNVRTEAWRVSPDPVDQPTGEFLIAQFTPGVDALGDESLAGEVERIAADLQPALDALMRAAGGPPSSHDIPTDDPLRALVEEFAAQRSYPDEKDRQQRAEREAMAKLLAADELPLIDVSDLRGIYNGSRYGHPGPQSILNTTIRDATPAELDEIVDRIGYLLWGEDDDATRIDRLLTGDLQVPGLKESVIMKLLAITHPDRYVPIFPLTGDMGKLQLMRLVGLEPPAPALSRGERQVAANDAIRQRLDAYFPGDPWGQAQFLYWLRTRGEEEPETATEEERLAQLADELLIDASFLREIVDLLRDKGQVVFYGPPGTGKTYLARELAKLLAPDPNRRMIVQFHPSTSYEDFFEGYRPEAVEGRLTYRLTPGPIALLAQRAELAPGVEHVMVIDEINRANLPKVLGELLFLLEYREERIRTVYRPEEAFELPKDLLFVCTMNTADRSIALIDAALRRRFHFVPFFPNDGPMAGLLDRWLERNGEDAWVGELVSMVNDELIDELGGLHLQIGPSHFMRPGLDEATVSRIWTYNIFPFIEDQLFGEPDRVAEYRFDRVLARFRRQSARDELDDMDVAGDSTTEE